MDRGAWRATVHGGHKELDTTEQLSTVYYIVLSHFKHTTECSQALEKVKLFLLQNTTKREITVEAIEGFCVCVVVCYLHSLKSIILHS